MGIALCNIWYVYEQICHHFYISQFMRERDLRPEILMVKHDQRGPICGSNKRPSLSGKSLFFTFTFWQIFFYHFHFLTKMYLQSKILMIKHDQQGPICGSNKVRDIYFLYHFHFLREKTLFITFTYCLTFVYDLNYWW